MRSRKRSEKNTSRAVANVVAQMEGVKSLAPPFSGKPDLKSQGAHTLQGTTPVQRKVTIGKEPLRTGELEEKGLSSKEEEIEDLINDEAEMYFTDTSELISYVDETTDNIGVLDWKGNNTWIRLLQDRFTVLGETHQSKNLLHIAKATGTEDFLYESITERPPGFTRNSELGRNIAGGSDEGFGRFKREKKDGNKYTGEDFLPRVAWAVNNVVYEGNLRKTDWYKLLKISLIYARDKLEQSGCFCKSSKLNAFYKNNRKAFDDFITLMDQNEEEEARGVIKANKVAFQTFGDMLLDRANQVYASSERTKDEFDRSYDPENASLKDEEQMDSESNHDRAEEAFKARDFSMFKRILQHMGKNTFLFGMGNLHRQNLAAALDARGVKHTHINTYIEEAEEKGRLGNSKESASNDEVELKPDKKKKSKGKVKKGKSTPEPDASGKPPKRVRRRGSDDEDLLDSSEKGKKEKHLESSKTGQELPGEEDGTLNEQEQSKKKSNKKK